MLTFVRVWHRVRMHASGWIGALVGAHICSLLASLQPEFAPAVPEHLSYTRTLPKFLTQYTHDTLYHPATAAVLHNLPILPEKALCRQAHQIPVLNNPTATADSPASALRANS